METSLMVARCVSALQQNTTVRRATYYAEPGLTVKATRRHRPDRRSKTEEFVVTIGRPNYAEREWIKDAKKAGEPLPFGPIFKFWPAKP